ncbi:hypothetical protein [Edwardsiella tarda]|uniref:Uncharacterized protein n=1 Tax=Edwardsiella tarda TaxID=636 RepID=A0A2A7U7M0_EDWTA|nr:hypothetical protein [Edwardsiella tarda]PEH74284.1 hypothetical protein CRM76_01180 [Edwardsiella tarda]
MKQLEPIIIRAGQPLTVASAEGSHIQIGNQKGVIHEITNSQQTEKILTTDFPDGHYTIVTLMDDEITSIQELTVLPLFTKQTREDYLRDIIQKIESVIDARLSGDESALAQMTVKGNTFTYESVAVLHQLRDKYQRELGSLIQKKRRAKGISSITNIKIRLTR